VPHVPARRAVARASRQTLAASRSCHAPPGWACSRWETREISPAVPILTPFAPTVNHHSPFTSFSWVNSRSGSFQGRCAPVAVPPVLGSPSHHSYAPLDQAMRLSPLTQTPCPTRPPRPASGPTVHFNRSGLTPANHAWAAKRLTATPDEVLHGALRKDRDVARWLPKVDPAASQSATVRPGRCRRELGTSPPERPNRPRDTSSIAGAGRPEFGVG
jgi:hypothetical protein